MTDRKRVRAAVVGCGNIGNVHGQVLEKMEEDGVVLSAAVDIRQERAEGFRERYGKDSMAVFGSLEELLAADGADVIHICTPHDLHTPMAVDVLDAGKSVFLEKPPAITAAEFAQLKEQEENSSGMLGICFQNRYNAATRKTDEILQSGSMGKLLGARAFVTWNRPASYYLESDWRGKLAREGGGALINQSIHTLDLLLRWMGRPDRVQAVMQNFHLQDITEVEDTVTAFLEFGEGRKACFYATNAYVTDAPVIIELTGEKGSIRLEGQTVICRYDHGEEAAFRLAGGKIMGKSYWGDGHDQCIREFYRCLQEGKPFPHDLRSAENTFQVMRQIYEEAGWRRF